MRAVADPRLIVAICVGDAIIVPEKINFVCDQFNEYDLYMLVLDGIDIPSNEHWFTSGNKILVGLNMKHEMTTLCEFSNWDIFEI
jgi:hypothetical protein